MKIAVVLLLFVFAGCTLTPTPKPSSDVPDLLGWQNRNAALYLQDEWLAHFSLIGVNAKQKFKTRVIWTQNQDTYQIKLKDFIGRTVAIIDGSLDGVKVKTSKGQHYEGSDADELVQNLFGIEIPVQGMHYWLRALPLPEHEYQLLALNNENLAEHMTQSGWQLDYDDYFQYETATLPQYITMQFEQLMLTVKVSHWELLER